jgi:precorrin-2 methylase
MQGIVAYKATGRLGGVLEAMRAHDRLTGAVYGERLGLGGERVCPAAALDGDAALYLATVIAPAPQAG